MPAPAQTGIRRNKCWSTTHAYPCIAQYLDTMTVFSVGQAFAQRETCTRKPCTYLLA